MNGILRGDVPLGALQTFACRSYCSCADVYLPIGNRPMLQQQCESFSRTVQHCKNTFVVPLK